MEEWLVGTNRGLFRGTIGGVWEQVGDYGFRVTSILRHAGKVFAGVGSGLWEVDLGGGRWTQLHDETLTEVLAIDAIPGDPGIVAASAYGVATGEQDSLGAVRWTCWSEHLAVDERFSNAVLALADGRWLVGTEAGLLVAGEGGRSWTHSGLMGMPVRGLWQGLGCYWAGTDERGIWRSVDGMHWEPAGSGLELGTVFALAESDGRIVAGTLEGVVVGDGRGYWQRSGPRMLMAAIAVDPAAPQRWLAGGDPGGLWFTEDGGQRWQQAAGLPTSVEAILAPEGK